MRRSRPARTARRREQRGAAAVEFGLVLTVLLPVLFGVVDYGVWFTDTLAVRHGVYEASRLAVVQRPSCTTGTTDMAKLVCTARTQVAVSGGTASAMVSAPQGWARGKPLLVCVMVRETAVTGMTPLPSDRLIRSKGELAIEVDSPVPTGATATAASSSADPAPAGTNWDWCA